MPVERAELLLNTTRTQTVTTPLSLHAASNSHSSLFFKDFVDYLMIVNFDVNRNNRR